MLRARPTRWTPRTRFARSRIEALALCVALALSLVLSLAARAHAQDAAAFAQQRFGRALTMYRARQYENALAEFQASLALYASPNSRLFIARCYRGLNRPVDAYAEYTRALAESEQLAANDRRYAATRDSARRELAAIEARIGRITVTAPGLPAGARITLAGRELPAPALGLPAPVPPGTVVLVAEAQGHQRVQMSISVRPGSTHAREVRLALLPGAVAPTPATAVIPTTAPAVVGVAAIPLATANLVAAGGETNTPGAANTAAAAGTPGSAPSTHAATSSGHVASAPAGTASTAGATNAANSHGAAVDRGSLVATGRGPLLLGGAISAGVGAALFVGGIAFYVAADAQYRRLEQCTTSGLECGATPASDRAAGRTLEGLQNTGLVAGAIALVGGVALITTGLLLPRPTVRLGVTHTGVALEGRF